MKFLQAYIYSPFLKSLLATSTLKLLEYSVLKSENKHEPIEKGNTCGYKWF